MKRLIEAIKNMNGRDGFDPRVLAATLVVYDQCVGTHERVDEMIEWIEREAELDNLTVNGWHSGGEDRTVVWFLDQFSESGDEVIVDVNTLEIVPPDEAPI